MFGFLQHFFYALLTFSIGNQPENDLSIFAALEDIETETINGSVTLDAGTIPTWLNGNFIRHGCAVFGNVRQQDQDLPNYVTHLFDCISMGTNFRLEDGHVTFTNRFYDTVSNDIYNSYDRDMNKSSVFFSTAFSKVNPQQMDKWSKAMNDPTKVAEVPAVSWWKVDNQAIAMSEMPIGAVIDPNGVTQEGNIQYKDDNMGYSQGIMFTNNPAHEQTDQDGTLWSTVSAVDMRQMPTLKIWRLVYKVGADKVRHVVGEYHFEDADLKECSRSPPFSPYGNFESRFGYLHSFSFTENYVILPETGYMHDPCFYAHYDKTKPFFPQGFTYEKDGHSRLLIMRKSDGVFVANIKTKPFFGTHQLGAYEDGDFIHMDMLLYNNADIYTRYMYLDSLIKDEPYTTDVIRITIDTRDWTASFSNLRKHAPETFEMPTINYAYNGMKYTYGYILKNFNKPRKNAITKLNVDTGFETEYSFADGLFAQEPQFVSRPNPQSEDDGVLLSQGVDGNKNKAFLTIIDAKTMRLVAHVTAPGRASFGLHNRFFDLKIGQ